MYIDLFDNIRECMRKIPNCKLFVFGDKNYTLMFEFLAKRDGLTLDGIIKVEDSVITPEECSGTPIVTLSDIPPNECLIVVALNMGFHESVKNQLANMGYNNVYCFQNDDFLGLTKIAQTEAFWLDRLKTELRDDSLRQKLLIYIADGLGIVLLHVLLMRGLPADGVVIAGDGGELPPEYKEISVFQAEKIPFEAEDCLILLPTRGEAANSAITKLKYCGFERIFNFSAIELIMLPFHEQFYGMLHKLYGVENKTEPKAEYKLRAKKILALYDTVNLCFMDMHRLYTLDAVFLGVKNKKHPRELYAMMTRDNLSKVMGRPQYVYCVEKSVNSWFFHYLKKEFCLVMAEDIPFWRYFIQNYPDRVKFRDCFEHYEQRMFTAENYRDGNVLAGNATIKFTDKEEKIGREKMKLMGIKGEFITFYARDNGYYKTISQTSEDIGDSLNRNSDIEVFRPMTKKILQRGIQSVRVGKFMDQKIEGEGIIDYASKHHDDFMDFYLQSKAKLYIGDNGTMPIIPAAFNTPVITLNNTCLSYKGDVSVTFPEKMLFLPKKVYLLRENRYLTLAEMLKTEEEEPNIVFARQKFYGDENCRFESNTAEEILDAVEEMLAWIDGTLEYSDEEKMLQDKFQKMFMDSIAIRYRFIVGNKISAKFLARNPYLLE